MTIYCRTCDLAFCERHVDEHDLLPSRKHDVEEDTDVPCAVCNGILLPRDRRPVRSCQE